MKVLLGELRDTVDRLAFGPGERLLAAVSGRGRVDLWDAVTGAYADSWYSRRRTVNDLAWLPDGRVVVAVAREAAELIDPDGERNETLADAAGGVALAAARDRVVVFGTHPGSGSRWRLVRREATGAGTVRAGWAEPIDGPGWHLAASADGTRVAAGEFWMQPAVRGRGSQSGAAVVVRYGETGAALRRIPVPHWSVTDRLAMFPDGRRVAAYITDRVYVWDADTGNPVREIVPPGYSTATTAVATHPDGRRLLTAEQDGEVRVWDVETGVQLATYHWGIGRLSAVAVSRDGLLAAAGGEDGKVAVWDLDV
jgi:WD40 repeat protein